MSAAPAHSTRGPILEPVEVGGVTVSRATLHNEEDINRKEIREGDIVIVQRAGDVIPQIVGPAGEHQPGTKVFRMPKKCPLCGFVVVKPEGEAMHRCPNRACPSRGLETLINWTGIADIEGVGEQTIRLLWERGLVRSLPDLYRLSKEQLLELDGFADISATAAIEAIQGSKQVPFSRVLLGLNISEGGLGARTEPRPSLRGRRSPVGGDRRRRSRKPRASAPTARRSSSSGSRTPRTARSCRSCASSACVSRWARRTGPSRGA